MWAEETLGTGFELTAAVVAAAGRGGTLKRFWVMARTSAGDCQ